MADLAKIAELVFQVLQQFDYTVTLYNDEDMEITEPQDARRMFEKDKNLMVSLVDDDDNSAIQLEIGRHTHAADVMGFIQSLRSIATQYNLTFRVRNFNQNIDPKRFSQLASISEKKKDRRMQVYEGMYGTSRSSYLRLENARMIVRHNARIDDSRIGARGRCVESIFVENSLGERFLFPSTNLAPARAMTQHVNQGGGFGDTVGQQITEMANEYANLATASRFFGMNTLTEQLTTIREACKCKMGKLRKTFEHLSRPSSYATESKAILDHANMLTETDDTDTRIDELRQILKGADLSKEVYECIAKTIKEANIPAFVTTEAVGVHDTVGILDHRVNKVVWDDFLHGKLRLKARPVFDRHEFRSAIAELIYRLGQVVPVVEDDGMANVLGFVADELMDASDKQKLVQIGMQALKAVRKQTVEPDVREAPSDVSAQTIDVLGRRVNATAWHELTNGKLRLTGKPVFDSHKFRSNISELIYRLGQIVPKVQDDSLANLLVDITDFLVDADDKRPYVKIGLDALKAARDGSQPQHKLADKNKVIQEFQKWFDRFTPEKILVEDLGNDPYNPIHEIYDDSLDSAIAAFDPAAFVDSSFMQDIIEHRDPKDPDENKLEKSEIMDGLKAYMRDYVEGLGDFYPEDDAVTSMADTVYDQAVDEVQSRGFVVTHSDMTEGPFEDANLLEQEELTREDVLLPAKNMGDDLSGEVSKEVVDEPDQQNMTRPVDSSYVSRLKVLAGMNRGANSQGY